MRKAAAPFQLSLLEIAPPLSAQKSVAVRKPAAPSPTRTPAVKTVKVVEKSGAGKREAAKETPVRVVLEPLQTMTAGAAVWKMSGKHGVAYVKDAVLAGELLGVEPKKLAASAMAVYCDKKGRPFAWQVRFDTARWDELCRRLA